MLAAVGAVLAAATVALDVAAQATAPDVPLAKPSAVTAPDANYVPSSACRECHEKEHASWHRTFHRTMTQEASPAAVLGDFATNNTLTYLGIRAEMLRTTNGFAMRLTDEQGKSQELSIDRTVGSHRIQQYLTRDGDRYVRLPVAYDLRQRRWMHLNGSFFHPDSNDYRQHVAEWNSNCVFCHNVKAQPGYDWDEKTWDTRVAELGIACGACHGEGRAHVEAARSPETVAAWKAAGDKADTRIVHPARLDSDRSSQICGHCHGQRVPEPLDRIREILSKGDPYDAGEDLAAFFRPIQRDSRIGHQTFTNRFWADGSPRLSAYEYQGLLRSKCHVEGPVGRRIQCITCHSMHGGDPAGQITAANRGNRTCLECHPRLNDPEALVRHTRHGTGSGSPLCYDCHMPRVVAGVMSAQRTHEISIPRPEDTVRFGKPNACNQCHLDRSVNWAIARTREFWPEAYAASAVSTNRHFNLMEGARSLFGGDALVRGLAAEALGPRAPGRMPPAMSTPLLVEALRDRYPIVRYFAANSLEQINPALPKPDYLATEAGRSNALAAWRATLDPAAQSNVVRAADALIRQRTEVDIEVGE